MRDPLLSVDGVRTGFGVNTVLHGVSLAVAEGEIGAILGLNGAGKSVTLKVVAGLLPAWSGRVLLDGRDVTSSSPEDRVAAGMGHVTQNRQIFPEFTVEENLRLGAYTLRRRARDRYDAVLARMFEQFPRLKERRTQLAGTMSGGEQAMLAIGRALMSEPRLLLVDEPSAGLAPSVVSEVADLLREVNATGLTILLVEQNVSAALAVAHSAHLMRRGQIARSGPVAELDHEVLASELGIGRLLSKTAGKRVPS